MRKMEHQEALQLKAVERYLLGELSGDLREQFEDHFFSCSECAREVESGAIFVDSARQILGHEQPEEHEVRIARPARPEPRGWLGNLLRPAFAGPALALLVLLTVYQGAVEIPKIRVAADQANTMQVVPTFSPIADHSRGGAENIVSVARGQAFQLFIDIPPDKQFADYNCDLETEGGASIQSVKVTAEQAASSFPLRVPSAGLQSGKYVVVVRGAASNQGGDTGRTEVERYTINVTFNN
jgi:hypothetical protein